MFFDHRVTVPANTTQASPHRETLPLDAGTVTQVDVVFPPGPAGLLHVTIWQGAAQLWPSNGDGSFASDAETLSWAEDFDLLQPPHELTAVCWNDDDSYPHSAVLRFALKRRRDMGLVDTALDAIRALGRSGGQ